MNAQSKELKGHKSYCWGDRERWEPLGDFSCVCCSFLQCVLGIHTCFVLDCSFSIPIFFSLHVPYPFVHQHANTPILKHTYMAATHSELVPIFLLSALPGVCTACLCVGVCWDWMGKKEILPVLYFVVPGFDVSIPSLPLCIWSLVWRHCFLSLLYISCFLQHYVPPPVFSHHPKSVKHFTQDLTNARRPKPLWQSKTSPGKHLDLLLAKLLMRFAELLIFWGTEARI